jgi:hypothetical protein
MFAEKDAVFMVGGSRAAFDACHSIYNQKEQR